MSNEVTGALPKTFYLAMGSNMGDRKNFLKKGIDYLNTLGEVLKVSSIYETEPVGMGDDAEPFFNLALMLQSSLSEKEMLQAIKNFEQQMGRDLANSHYQPRRLDIDILMVEGINQMGNTIQPCIINENNLIIPHKEMHLRAFVLVPLNEIAPGAMHPVLNKPISQLLKELQSNESLIKRLTISLS
jgi:2-amino-4-hydroxy-6-hydroxymethyldihydropteridine diphosphokinase